ncbi:integrase catalytic domain-containing protein [Trichonephila clavipes]|nr:integrase catalytic domain-containing protein [Trichonephila clavipes]
MLSENFWFLSPSLHFSYAIAPFLATRTLKQIAIDNEEKFLAAAESLETDFYVDALVSGASNIETGKEIQKQLIELLNCAENYKSLELHGFSDASEKSFGASIYLRCTNSSEQSSIRLLCSKSRIAPIKLISIPCLELCTAVLLSKLGKKVISSLKLGFDGVYLWTDSMIVLGGLQTDPLLLKTFVGKRVSQIQEITKSYFGQHIRSEQNPSDLVSRGLSAENLVNCELRFARNAKNPHSKRTGPLTSEELTDAEQCLLRRVQSRDNFPRTSKDLNKVRQCRVIRWKRDYLSNLQQCTKWYWKKRSVAINDMVLIVQDTIPPCKWKLGRVVEINCRAQMVKDMELEVNEDDIEEIIMGHENELTIEEL